MAISITVGVLSLLDTICMPDVHAYIYGRGFSEGQF